MPTIGRGGAGNYAYQEEAKRQAKTDLEANRQPEDDSAPQSRDTESLAQKPLQEYAYSGRGGAGNLISPTALAQNGTFQSTTQDTAAAQRIKAPVFSGRGGSGNYREPTPEAEEPEVEQEEVRAQVEKDVEMELPKPVKAYLGGGRQVLGQEKLGYVGVEKPRQ